MIHSFRFSPEHGLGPATSKATGTLFAHKENLDGTWDSICSSCFQTIAVEGSKADLFAAEQSHKCPGLDLQKVLHPERAKTSNKPERA